MEKIFITQFLNISDTYRNKLPKSILAKMRPLWLKQVKYTGYALEYVPKELRDREMCLRAVKGDGGALQFVPLELRDREMCLAAVKQWPGNIVLRYGPKKLKDSIKQELGI